MIHPWNVHPSAGLKKPQSPKDELEQPRNKPATDDFSQNVDIQVILKLSNEKSLNWLQNEIGYHGASLAWKN